MQKKRIIIIAIILIIIVALGVGVYFGLKKAQRVATLSPQGGSLPVGGATPLTGQQNEPGAASSQDGSPVSFLQQQKNNLFLLAKGPAVGFWVVATTSSSTIDTSNVLKSSVYYLNKKGEVIQMLDVDKEQVVSSAPFGVPVRVTANRDGTTALVMFDSGTYALFFMNTLAWEELDSGVISVSFSPDGKQFVYAKQTSGGMSLYARSLSKAQRSATLVVTLPLLDRAVIWGTPDRIFFIPKPTSKVNGDVWYLSLANKKLYPFISGYGVQMIFNSVAPHQTLVSSLDINTRSILGFILDQKGNKITDSSVPTFADKCVFAYDGASIFCAVARENNKQGSALDLPDDYLQQRVSFYDDLYSMNSSDLSNYRSVITNIDINFDISSLLSINGQLFFLNRLDGSVYLFNLSS